MKTWTRVLALMLALMFGASNAEKAAAQPSGPQLIAGSYAGGFSGSVFEGFNFIHGTALPANIPVAGIFKLTADGAGNFTSGLLRSQKTVGINPSVECHYVLTSGTYFVNNDETGGTQTNWTLEGGINCPATFTSQTLFVLAEVHRKIAGRVDWVQSNLAGNTLQGPVSGTLVRR